MNKDSKNCVLFFVKYPVPGRVKTRLAEQIGQDAALDKNSTALETIPTILWGTIAAQGAFQSVGLATLLNTVRRVAIVSPCPVTMVVVSYSVRAAFSALMISSVFIVPRVLVLWCCAAVSRLHDCNRCPLPASVEASSLDS